MSKNLRRLFRCNRVTKYFGRSLFDKSQFDYGDFVCLKSDRTKRFIVTSPLIIGGTIEVVFFSELHLKMCEVYLNPNLLEICEDLLDASVKLVVFRHPETEKFDGYCSYCPAIDYFGGRGDTIEKVIADVQSQLLTMLCHRFIYRNLQNLGWRISGHSVEPPTFVESKLIELTEKSYGISLTDYKIVTINVRDALA